MEGGFLLLLLLLELLPRCGIGRRLGRAIQACVESQALPGPLSGPGHQFARRRGAVAHRLQKTVGEQNQAAEIRILDLGVVVLGLLVRLCNLRAIQSPEGVHGLHRFLVILQPKGGLGLGRKDKRAQHRLGIPQQERINGLQLFAWILGAGGGHVGVVLLHPVGWGLLGEKLPGPSCQQNYNRQGGEKGWLPSHSFLPPCVPICLQTIRESIPRPVQRAIIGIARSGRKS